MYASRPWRRPCLFGDHPGGNLESFQGAERHQAERCERPRALLNLHSLNLKSTSHLLVAVQTQSECSPAPAAESKPHGFHRDDFVLLTGDDNKCRIARMKDISILEAFRNATLVHFAGDKFLIRRSLVEVARRLDSSIFFRVSRDCIVNLSQVKQPRLLKDGSLIFLLKDGKEIVFSRRQGVLFRAIRGL